MLRRRATLTAWQRTTSPTGCSTPDPGWTICAEKSRRARRGRPARTSGPSPSRAGIRRSCWRTWPRWFRTGWLRSSGSSRATRNPSRSGGSRPTRSGSRPIGRDRALPVGELFDRIDDRTELAAAAARRAFGRADRAPRHPSDARRDDGRSGHRADAHQPHRRARRAARLDPRERARARLKARIHARCGRQLLPPPVLE